MNLTDLIQKPIDDLPRTQPRTIQRLRYLGVETYFDLLHHTPHRYQDFTAQFDPRSFNPETEYSVQGTVAQLNQTYTRNKKTIQKGTIQTEQSPVDVIWFNQSYLMRSLPVGSCISASGKISLDGNKPTLKVMSYELLEDGKEPIHTARLVPIYPETWGISSKTIREKISFLLHEYQTGEQEDILPVDIIKLHNLFSLRDTFHQIHFPKSYEVAERAKQRLAFNELFISHARSRAIRRQWDERSSIVSFKKQTQNQIQPLYDEFTTQLPFELTKAQQLCMEDILADLADGRPMNRFIQGDVGSGKTIIAVISAYILARLGYKSLIMAPTEVLAEQHAASFAQLLSDTSITVGLHTATKKIKQYETADILIGTHALLSKSVQSENIGLVVIDEQHRFGVKQRALLRSKSSRPHVLTMTATPIPRTISLTMYGDLDVSELYEKPKGRLPIKTYVVPEFKRENAYDWVTKQIQENQSQVFIICPLIQESENESMKSVRAVTDEFERLQKDVFPHHSLALLHGKQKAPEKEQVLTEFKNKKHQILVSTSVVEVGIDIPNATIMIIEGAERYGLAQLHQLRGRVGRGDKQSHCLLFTSQANPEQKERLQFFARNSKGIDLAEYDLKRRGPGSVYGIEQHGRSLLKYADTHTVSFIQTVKNSVEHFHRTYSLSEYPFLQQMIDSSLQELIARD